MTEENLYNQVLFLYKTEWAKRAGRRNVIIIKSLKSVMSLFSKYWRNTSKFPDHNIACSFMEDVIDKRGVKLETFKDQTSEAYQEVSDEYNYLTNLLPKNYEYVEVNFEDLKASETKVKWDLHHNKRNVIIRDKSELKKL